MKAQEMFKEEEKIHGGKSYKKSEQRIIKYGKINNNTAFRIIQRVKWIGNNSNIDVEILERNIDGTYRRTGNSFWHEKEPNGGRFVNKQYKDAIEYANEYIKTLKSATQGADCE